MDSAQQEYNDRELELLELALAQSRAAIDNLEEVILRYAINCNSCRFNQQSDTRQIDNIPVATVP